MQNFRGPYRLRGSMLLRVLLLPRAPWTKLIVEKWPLLAVVRGGDLLCMLGSFALRSTPEQLCWHMMHQKAIAGSRNASYLVIRLVMLSPTGHLVSAHLRVSAVCCVLVSRSTTLALHASPTQLAEDRWGHCITVTCKKLLVFFFFHFKLRKIPGKQINRSSLTKLNWGSCLPSRNNNYFL